MAEITSEMIKTLRERTQAGMLACKKALDDNNGDMEKAADFLRKKGLAAADKKAGRDIKEGVVAVKIDDSKKRAVMVEINCETDFVAKNDNFTKLTGEVLEAMAEADESASEVPSGAAELVKNAIGTIGENMGIGKFFVFHASDNGIVSNYVHSNKKIGVIVALEAESAAGAQKAELEELGKEIAMQAAAAMPQYLDSSEIPEETVSKEKEIYLEQMKNSGKPEHVLEKIVDGKINKYYSEVCLLNQVYIKDSGKSISDVIKEYSTKIGETITIKKFARIQIGA